MTARDENGQIWVEFYGLARQRTGTSRTALTTARTLPLAAVWQCLVERFPELAAPRCEIAQLVSTYRINLDGQQFVTDPQTPIQRGQCVLIMSADAGG